MALRPKIISNIVVNTSLIAPAGDRVAAMIGTAQWGPIDTVTTVSNMNTFIETFGTQKSGDSLTGVQGADLFFNNGGTMLFVRVADSDADYSSVTLTNGVTDVITFSGKYKGTYGDNILVTVTANPVTSANRDITITDGTNTEFFNNNGAGYTTNQAIETAINASSVLCTAEALTGHETSDLVDAASNQQLTGGDDGDDEIVIGDYTDTIDNLLMQEDFNFLLVPGYTTDSGLNTIAARLDTRASSEAKYARFISGIDTNETIATAGARTSSSKRLTLVAPACTYTSRYSGSEVTLDGSYTACAYAGKLATLDIEVSGTHETVVVDGLQVDSTGKEYYTKSEQEQLLTYGVAPISKIGTQVQMVRGVTRNGDSTSVFFDEYIVDIVDYVQAELEDYLNSILGKPKRAVDIKTYQARCDAVLENMVTQGIIEEFNDTVIVEGSSPDSLNVTVSIKPTYNTNFVYLTLNIN